MLMWIKKGLIYKPDGSKEWMKTHGTLPIADHIKNDLYRIYFSARDSFNRSTVAFIEIDIKNPQNILKISKYPVLKPGKLGTFDESGVMAHSIVNFKKKKYMYYTGWNLKKTVPLHWSIGLAISSDDGKTFKKYSDGPLLERNTVDPFFVLSPTVFIENKKWKMWYSSGAGWKGNTSPKNSYYLKYAESNDGIKWKRDGKVIINLKKNESRIGRPSILKEKNLYKMWYSYANQLYKIGYAESNDGVQWKRKDNCVGITVSKNGWDSQMIEYPFVFLHKESTYMLYNGNNYGKTGFGLAVLKT